MSKISKETVKNHVSVVRRILSIVDRDITLHKLQETLEQQGIKASIPYVMKLRNKAQSYWRHKYDYHTKSQALAQADEWFEYLIGQLRKIVNDENINYNYAITAEKEGGKGKINQIKTFSQMNRISAIKEIRETIKLMLQLQMDFGFIDRKLGELQVVDGANLREIARQLYVKQQTENQIIDVTNDRLGESPDIK